jgi:hypothetical protein
MTCDLFAPAGDLVDQMDDAAAEDGPVVCLGRHFPENAVGDWSNRESTTSVATACARRGPRASWGARPSRPSA